MDPGIDGAESIFGYKFVLVKEVGGGDPYIIEQVASLVVVHCFSTFIVCFFEWCVEVYWDVNGGDFWGPGSILCGVVGNDEIECDGLAASGCIMSFDVGLFCEGEGPLGVNEVVGLGQAVLANSLI